MSTTTDNVSHIVATALRGYGYHVTELDTMTREEVERLAGHPITDEEAMNTALISDRFIGATLGDDQFSISIGYTQ